MTTTDPSWLFSTAAQSAAAIVAIVGGFLATRIVSLSAERDSLRHRIQTLDALLAGQREQLERTRQLLLTWDAEDFIGFHAEDLVEARGNIPLDDLVRRGGAEGQDANELRAFYDQARSLIPEAFQALQSDMTTHGFPPPSFQDYSHRLDLGSADGVTRIIYEAVYEHVRSQLREAASPYQRMTDLPYDIVSPSSSSGGVTAYHDLLRRERALASEVEQAAVEKTAYERRLEDLGRPDPTTVWGGFGVLGYFGLGGVAFPVFMLRQPTSLIDPMLRWVTLQLFLSGVLAVVAYFWIAIRRALAGKEVES